MSSRDAMLGKKFFAGRTNWRSPNKGLCLEKSNIEDQNAQPLVQNSAIQPQIW
jgi:hypothetical protein